MENYLDQQQHEGMTRELTRDFFKNVYGYMFMALLVSGAIAYYVGSSSDLFAQFFVTETGGISPLFYVIMFSPLVLTFIIQGGYRRFSLPTLTVLYVIYSALMGLMLSTIFLAYSMNSIAITFFVSAGAFGGMAVLGYTTKTDLTKFGSLLYMAFIGLFIAMIVNIFMKSGMMDFVISIAGVFIFTGLTAYWMQKLKSTAEDNMLDGIERRKLALVGGMTLYILFINLFLSLLRLMGNRE